MPPVSHASPALTRPVAVCWSGCRCRSDSSKISASALNDSKQLAPELREEIYSELTAIPKSAGQSVLSIRSRSTELIFCARRIRMRAALAALRSARITP